MTRYTLRSKFMFCLVRSVVVVPLGSGFSESGTEVQVFSDASRAQDGS
jgi:hypothetical protein